MSSGYYSIDQELANFLESDVAMIVAASDVAKQPTITRGFGARVSKDRAHVTVFVGSRQAATMLQDIEATGRVSVNATRISDYESFQLKGLDARITDMSREDKQHVERYLRDVQAEMGKIGLTPRVAENIFRSRNDQALVGIVFELHEVYCQTPGPGAGKPRDPRA